MGDGVGRRCAAGASRAVRIDPHRVAGGRRDCASPAPDVAANAAAMAARGGGWRDGCSARRRARPRGYAHRPSPRRSPSIAGTLAGETEPSVRRSWRRSVRPLGDRSNYLQAGLDARSKVPPPRRSRAIAREEQSGQRVNQERPLMQRRKHVGVPDANDPRDAEVGEPEPAEQETQEANAAEHVLRPLAEAR